MKAFIKLNRIRLIIILVITALIIITSIIMRNQWVAEYIFARGIARAWGYVIGNITSIVPISIIEMLIIAVILSAIAIIISLIRAIKRKRWQSLFKWATSLVIVAISILLIYNVTASANYYRYAVPIPKAQAEQGEVLSIAEYFLEDYNYLAETLPRDEYGNIVSPYTDRELARLMREEFKRLDNTYYNGFTPLAKPIIFHPVMSFNGIAGMFFSPTAEANINSGMPSFDKPHTMAHELAHASGVMREDEANLVAAYITLTSKDDFIRYSGYINTFYNLSGLIFYVEGAEEAHYFSENLSERIRADYEYMYDYWSEYSTFINRISNFFNDLYLKFQGQKEGTDTYQGSYSYEVISGIDEYGEITCDIEYSKIQMLYFYIYNIR